LSKNKKGFTFFNFFIKFKRKYKKN